MAISSLNDWLDLSSIESKGQNPINNNRRRNRMKVTDIVMTPLSSKFPTFFPLLKERLGTIGGKAVTATEAVVVMTPGIEETMKMTGCGRCGMYFILEQVPAVPGKSKQPWESARTRQQRSAAVDLL
ncbi:uncharacterized protein RBU57_000343 isoform 2-T2 [Macrochelys suwanniensis]